MDGHVVPDAVTVHDDDHEALPMCCEHGGRNLGSKGVVARRSDTDTRGSRLHEVCHVSKVVVHRLLVEGGDGAWCSGGGVLCVDEDGSIALVVGPIWASIEVERKVPAGCRG